MTASVPSHVLNLGLLHAGLLLKDVAVVIRHYDISDRHLRQKLAELGLQRRRFSDVADDDAFISNALHGSGNLHGCRFMYKRCLGNGVRPRNEDVPLLLGAMDREGVKFKKARRLKRRTFFANGPNYVWNVDITISSSRIAYVSTDVLTDFLGFGSLATMA